MSNKDISYYPIDDYVQSANTLFHFMQKSEYLKSALVHKALIPRFCIEDVSYLGIIRDSFKFQEVAILEKCFCDILICLFLKINIFNKIIDFYFIFIFI